jgi:death on curing protein
VRYLSLAEVLLLHRLVMEQSRQQALLRDLGALESAIAQPRQTFGGEDLYPGLAGKAAALGFSLIQNHPFLDGNKRVGHAAMISFLRLNGRRIEATVDEAEQAILQVASGSLDRAGLQAWIEAHEVARS